MYFIYPDVGDVSDLPHTLLIQVLPDTEGLSLRSYSTEKGGKIAYSREIDLNKFRAAWEQIQVHNERPRDFKMKVVANAGSSGSSVSFVNQSRDPNGRYRKRRGKIVVSRRGEDEWEESIVTIEKVKKQPCAILM